MPDEPPLVEIADLAALARLVLTAEEQDALSAAACGHPGLRAPGDRARHDGVAPTTHVPARLSAERPDEVQPSLSQADALANAPEPAPGPGCSRCRGSSADGLAAIRTPPRSATSVARREVSAVEVCRACLDRIARADAGARRLSHRRRRASRWRAPRASIDDRRRRRAAAARRARRRQGQHLHARPPDDRRVAHARALRPALRRDRRAAARAGGRRRHRQDELRRVRDGLVDRELGVRTDEQPVGARPDAGRIERRLGRRGRRRAWLRWRWARTRAARSASPPPSAASSA